MMILVTGGSGNGRSAFAEECILQSSAPERIYAATMRPFGAEAQARIRRHRRMREGKGFVTCECCLHGEMASISGDCAVLLEDLANLAANELFEEEGAGEETAEVLIQAVSELNERVMDLVIVTDDVFSDGIVYTPETRRYMEILAETGSALAEMADEVYEVVCGIPLKLKGVR